MVSWPTIALKRVYDAPGVSDGHRVLVDRLWPRGLAKEEARIDLWLRDLAPQLCAQPAPVPPEARTGVGVGEGETRLTCHLA